MAGHCGVACTALLVLAPSAIRAGRRRRPWCRRNLGAQKALRDDLALVADEALSTIEDAWIHATRVSPWLSGPAALHGDHDGPEHLPEQRLEAPVDGPTSRRRIVVLGTGWAAHAIAKVIDASNVDVCFVSPRNYFVFTPLLAAASVGTVECRSILEPIRSANPTVRFYQGQCSAINLKGRCITVKPMADAHGGEFHMPYDTLVLAVGVRPACHAVPGVNEHCLFLKDVEDARSIRRRVTACLETADLPSTMKDKKKLLTFVVIGGGPTGCEFCGELQDFVRNDLQRFYPKLAPFMRILLVHRGQTILPAFGPDLKEAARETLEAQAIEVMTGTSVKEVMADAIRVARKTEAGMEEETIPCRLCVWAAGNAGQDIVTSLREQLPIQAESSTGETARLLVDEWLRVQGVKDGSIMALGDCSRIAGLSPPLPQTAQVAAQQGAYVARLLNRCYDLGASGPPRLPQDAPIAQLARARGQTEAPCFNFLDLGRLAYLGKANAVAEINLGSTAVSHSAGRAAYVLWRSVYVVKQVSLRNRILVLFDWAKTRVFGRDLTDF